MGEPGFEEEKGEAVCPECGRGVEGCEICCAVRIVLKLTLRGLERGGLTLSKARLHTSRSLDCIGQLRISEEQAEFKGY